MNDEKKTLCFGFRFSLQIPTNYDGYERLLLSFEKQRKILLKEKVEQKLKKIVAVSSMNFFRGITETLITTSL